MSNRLEDRLNFDMVKYRIESAPYDDIYRAMSKVGCTDTGLKMLLMRAHGIMIEPMANPPIFFVVTNEMMESINQDLRSSSAATEPAKKDAILCVKVGTSPQLALTEDAAKNLFESKIQNHNASV